jgi:serine protease inhibitor
MTRDKIKHLIKKDMLSALTRLVLVNAIYFKGDWAAQFDPKLTKEQDFSVSPSITVKASMMMQEKKFNWAYLETLASSMVELPYKGDRIVMQVLLPGERHGLGELEEKLENQNIQELFEKKSFVTKVNIQLPKFKLEQTIPLTEHLTNLGMKDMFSEGLADFSGIDGSKQLFVSNVVQKAFIEVNEEGSEAAAATAAVMEMKCMPAPPEQFVADHPFIFFLRDKTTGMLLFQGRVVNPTE